MLKEKPMLSQSMIEQIKKHVLDGWSFNYASALVGINRGKQNYLFKFSNRYKDLHHWYRMRKAEMKTQDRKCL